MGMGTFTSNMRQIRNEFKLLNNIYQDVKKNYNKMNILSMGMSNDYQIAIEEGSNMIRVGSAIFGETI